MSGLSIVLAAYNEEDAIQECVQEVLSYARGRDVEIILVNDGSTDKTGPLIDSMEASHPGLIRSVHLPQNRGMGAALKAGYAMVTRPWVTMLPADGQIKPVEIDKLLALSTDADVVTTLYGNRPVAPVRRLISLALRALTVLIVGTRAKTEGNYLVRREVLSRFNLHSDSFLLNLEIPIRAKRAGLRVKTATISVSPRIAGVSKAVTPRRITDTFVELFELRRILVAEALRSRFGNRP